MRTIGLLIGITLGFLVTLWLVNAAACESIVPGMAEVRAVAEDAKASSDKALADLEAAKISGDPEEIARATADAEAAAAKADEALEAVARAEAKVLEWAEKVQSGEITPEDGQELGGFLGTLIAGPRGGVVGTLLGGVAAGWWYRRIARQVLAGVDAAKEEVPELKAAFRLDGVRDAVSTRVSRSAWKFIEDNRA